MKKKYATLLMMFIGHEALFAIAAIALFQGFQILCTDLYDFSHILMVWPMFFSYLLLIYWYFSNHAFLHTPDSLKRRKYLKVNAIIFIALGSILFAFVLINIFNGNYVMGWINKLFPLDILLIDLTTVLLGIFTLWKKDFLIEKIPAICKDYHQPKFITVLYVILGGLYILIEAYLFGGYMMSALFLDVSNPSFVYTIPLLLLCALGICILVPMEIILMRDNEKPLKKKTVVIIGLVTAIVVTALSLTVLILNFGPYADYIALNLQGFFVLDYIASLNLAPFLVSIPPLLIVWVGGASTLIYRLKKRNKDVFKEN